MLKSVVGLVRNVQRLSTDLSLMRYTEEYFKFFLLADTRRVSAAREKQRSWHPVILASWRLGVLASSWPVDFSSPTPYIIDGLVKKEVRTLTRN